METHLSFFLNTFRPIRLHRGRILEEVFLDLRKGGPEGRAAK